MERDTRRREGTGWALAAFTALAILFRLPGHLNSGLWFDEIWLLTESVRVPLGTLLTTFQSDNNHPLYSLLSWLSVRAMGEQAWTLRLPAMVFGVASVGMLWNLALLVTNRLEAAVATALLVVSYHHIWFSQNARGYTMLLFWTLAATYFLVKTYARAGRSAWVLYAICLALATYTHASAVLVAGAHGLVSLGVIASTRSDGDTRFEERWAPLLGLALAGALSLVMHAPMLGEMLSFFANPNPAAGAGNGPGQAEWMTLWWTVSAVVASLGVPRLIGYSALLGGSFVVVVGTAACLRRSRTHALLFILPGILAIGATVAMGRSLRPRFLFHLSGFALLIVVAGAFALCEWAARRVPTADGPKVRAWLERGAAVAMLLASLVILPKAYTLPKQDFEGALEYVQGVQRSGVVVATVGLTVMPYRDYYQAGFVEITSVEHLDRLLGENEAVYILHTIPIFLDTNAPELASRMVAADEVARFPGSLGDGDVLVYRLERPPPR